MVVAAIAPDLNAQPILLLLQTCNIRIAFNLVKIILDVRADVLSEDRQIGRSVLRPEAFIDLISWALRSEHSNATWLVVDPEAFKAALVGPRHLSISALDVLVVYDGSRAFRCLNTSWSRSLLVLCERASIFIIVNGHHAHLPIVSHRCTEVHGFERQVCILNAENYSANMSALILASLKLTFKVVQ